MNGCKSDNEKRMIRKTHSIGEHSLLLPIKGYTALVAEQFNKIWQEKNDRFMKRSKGLPTNLWIRFLLFCTICFVALRLS